MINLEKQSPEIVEPFKQVVETAMLRVREGQVDGVGQQKVSLKCPSGNRMYQVIDTHVQQISYVPRRVISVGELDSGLFIEGIQLDENGVPIGLLKPIQTPRDVSSTTNESLLLDGDSNPGDIIRLAQELASAVRITQGVYTAAIQSFLQQPKA